MPNEGPPKTAPASTENTTEVITYIVNHLNSFPEDIQQLLVSAIEIPQIITFVDDFSRTLRILHHKAHGHSLRTYFITPINAIETAEALKLLKNSFDGRWDPQSLCEEAETFPNLIKNSLNLVHRRTQELFSRKLRDISADEFTIILKITETVRKTLDKLPRRTSSLLKASGGTSFLRQSIRKVLTQELFGPYYAAEHSEATEMDRLVRACLHVVRAFDLSKSASADYVDLFGYIMSQPGMMETGMNKAQLILTHFHSCLRPGYETIDSHGAIEAYLAHHCGRRYRDYWDCMWGTVKNIMGLLVE